MIDPSSERSPKEYIPHLLAKIRPKIDRRCKKSGDVFKILENRYKELNDIRDKIHHKPFDLLETLPSIIKEAMELQNDFVHNFLLPIHYQGKWFDYKLVNCKNEKDLFNKKFHFLVKEKGDILENDFIFLRSFDILVCDSFEKYYVFYKEECEGEENRDNKLGELGI